MLEQQELRQKGFKIFLGMPMYGGMLTESTMHGLLQLQQWTMAKGVGLRFQTMGNESLITRARNTVVSMMFDDKDFIATHLLFIDSDIGFTAQNIERLLLADKDIACGIYPRKHIHLEKVPEILKNNPEAKEDEIEAKALGYNLNFDNPGDVRVENGFAKVNEAATGMMLVKREVFRTMMKKFPERKYNSDQIINGKAFSSNYCYDLFAAGVYGEKKKILIRGLLFFKTMARMWWRNMGRCINASNTFW